MGSGTSKNKEKATIITVVISATRAFATAGKHTKNQIREGGEGHEDEHNGGMERDDVSEKEQSVQVNGDITGTTRPIDETGENGVDDEDEWMLSNASLKIQSKFRGFKERRQRKKEIEMAIKIQRVYRRHTSLKQDSPGDTVMDPVAEDSNTTAETQPIEKQSEATEEKPDTSKTTKEWLEKSQTKVESNTKTHVITVGQQIQEDFVAFQNEITELKWYAEQQLERAICGSDFVGPRVVLVSSNVPKGELLSKIVKDNVLIFNYDFNKVSFDELLENINVNLQSYKEGSKARSICIYCQGGPGFMYIKRGKVVTVAKLKKTCEEDQVRFFKELGKLITKIEPQKSVIHIMGSNIHGKEKGQKLFDKLQEIIKPNQVRFEAPLELSPAGVDMIEAYFDFEKYKIWRSNKHLKIDVDL